MKASIKVKIMAGLLIPISLAVVVIFLMTAHDIQQQSTNMLGDAAAKELAHVDYSLSLFLDEAKRNTVMMSEDMRAHKVDSITTSFLSDIPPENNEAWPSDFIGQQLRIFYKTILKSHPAYVDAYIGTKNGAFVIGGDDLMPASYDPRKRPWYKAAVASADKAIISKAYTSTTGEAMISTGKAYSDGGPVLGVAAMDISLGEITNQIGSIKLGKDGYVLLFQDDGVVIAEPRNKDAGFKNAADLENPDYKRLFNMSSGITEAVFNDTDYMAIVYTSPELGWKFVGLIPQAEVMAPVYSTLSRIFITFSICMVVIAIFIWMFMDWIAVRPLKRVVEFLGFIDEGEYSERIDLKRNDEIGQIYSALNDMSATLENNIQEITLKTEDAEAKAMAAGEATAEAEQAKAKAETAKAEGMQQAAYQLESVVQEVSRVSELIAKQADEIRGGTDVQRERIQATATAMEEMNATVLEVARNASSASQQGQDAKDKALNGADVVNQSVDAINSIQQQASELKSNMGELDERAQDIGNIMGVITDIADQTNLLALNAAIEAARAGEAGRGFAVVADEVRKLAEKTMTATKEVGDSIEAMQRAADRNVSAMEKAVGDLGHATDLSNSSGSVLNEIVSVTEHSADQIQSIATAAEQQSAASEEINQSIDEINSIAMDTASSVSSTIEALGELQTQGEQLIGLVQELKSES